MPELYVLTDCFSPCTKLRDAVLELGAGIILVLYNQGSGQWWEPLVFQFVSYGMGALPQRWSGLTCLGPGPYEWGLGREREPWPLSHPYQEFSLCNMDLEEMRVTDGLSLLERDCIPWLMRGEGLVFLAITAQKEMSIKLSWGYGRRVIAEVP